MIVSSNNHEQFLKADLRFQRFSDQALEEGYRIVLHNTETHEEQAYQISEGSFRKEFQLTERTRPATQTSSTSSASRSCSAGTGRCGQ
jgi:predicted deacetylase